MVFPAMPLYAQVQTKRQLRHQTHNGRKSSPVTEQQHGCLQIWYYWDKS